MTTDNLLPAAFHGGAFWESLDPTYRATHPDVVAADVLDAWFPPAPELMAEFTEALPALIRTSPPTHAAGMEAVIAEHRELAPESVLAGPGSSSLIHLLLGHLLTREDTLAVLEPTYSEYRFVAENLVGAKVASYTLDSDSGFALDLDAWTDWVHRVKPRVAVLVRPNNPTGSPSDLSGILARIPDGCTVILDEAYLDYTDMRSGDSIACRNRNVVVIESLSKGFGLSGLRSAYAVMHPDLARELRPKLPPWWVSGPAQWFGCRVWDHLSYYRQKVSETDTMRAGLEAELSQLPGVLRASCANWVLWEHGGRCSTPDLLTALRHRHIYVRDASATGPSLSPRTLRIAVRPPEEQQRLLAALRDVCLASS